ncbi:hypothetical protein HDU87_001586 [Geranomyces variabilis]|uniref:Uncharacterized protein n=1 Tax=Geranomyces variabilis TaxID=109894 RepID=A0AAD5XP97_9FUNG|nr:hypothetical protein HDU87_001586 [Geranomyces variabilis]
MRSSNASTPNKRRSRAASPSAIEPDATGQLLSLVNMQDAPGWTEYDYVDHPLMPLSELREYASVFHKKIILDTTVKRLEAECADLLKTVAGAKPQDVVISWVKDRLERLAKIVGVPCPFAEALLKIAHGSSETERKLAIEYLMCPMRQFVGLKQASACGSKQPFTCWLLLATRALFEAYSAYRTPTIQLVLEAVWYCPRLLQSDSSSSSSSPRTCEDDVVATGDLEDKIEETATKRACYSLLFKALLYILRGCNVKIVNINCYGSLAAITAGTTPFLRQWNLESAGAPITAALHPAVLLRVVLNKEFSRDVKEEFVGMYLKHEAEHLWHIQYAGCAERLAPMDLSLEMIIKSLNVRIQKEFKIVNQYKIADENRPYLRQYLRLGKLKTFALAKSTAFSNIAACGLLRSSDLHTQLGPSARYLNRALTPAQLLLQIEPDVRKMFCLPPVISTANNTIADTSPPAPEVRDIPATAVMDVDTNPNPRALELDRTVDTNWSRHITQVLSNYIRTPFSSEIVHDAKAIFDPYALLLKVYMRGYRTIVNRLFSTRGSIIRNQAGCLVTEAVPFMRAKSLSAKAKSSLKKVKSASEDAKTLREQSELDWRPFVLIAGCNSKSKKVVYIREYLVLCQFDSADKPTGKFAFLFSRLKDRGALTPPKWADAAHFTTCVNKVLEKNLVMLCCKSGRVYAGLRWKNEQTAEASLQSLQKLDTVLGFLSTSESVHVILLSRCRVEMCAR